MELFLFTAIDMIIRTNGRHNILRTLGYNCRHFTSSLRQRRVVVTGLGVVSPLGCGVTYSWNKLLNGECGITQLCSETYKKLPCQVAARVPRGTEHGEFDVNERFSSTDQKIMSQSTLFAVCAAEEALTDAKWFPENTVDKEMTGVAVGIGMVDLADICDTAESFKRGYNRVSPYFLPRILPNMAAGHISIKYGFQGPNHAVSTACATGAHSIGDAFRFIQNGYANVMVCGGAEASINPLSIAGFCRIRALSTSFNDKPMIASRPFDRDRNGFVMGEGSAILVLEELSHAKSRNAHIYGEILGYGVSGDASHLTAPCEDGRGALLAMTRSMEDANVQLTDITYINAHATSTPIGDAVEAKAIKTLFGKHSANVAISSTKGAHGHLLGAAGNLEAVFTVMACYSSLLPPTINLGNIADGMDLNYVRHKATEWKTASSCFKKIALKNSFGFGGTNASLCIAEYKDE